MATNTLYIKMKSETGSEVWRNVAPSVKTGDNRLNFVWEDIETGEDLQGLANAYVAVQTEEPALVDGEFQFKITHEETLIGGTKRANVTPGVDSWTDTTDEKFIISITNGEKDGTAKVPHAATSLGTGDYYSDYEAAVSDFSRAVATNFRLGDTMGTYTWTQTHLTGTKDTLVAQNS